MQAQRTLSNQEYARGLRILTDDPNNQNGADKTWMLHFLRRLERLLENPRPLPKQRHGAFEVRPVMKKVNLAAKLALLSDYWQPKIVGELNGQQVKLVKFQGEFVWHKHDQEDELFLVVHGRFRMEFREHAVWLEAGEFLIVPRGVEHRPVAEEEVHVLLFEPASTLNTGDVQNERTIADLDRI